jgi:hypothetical protein
MGACAKGLGCAHTRVFERVHVTPSPQPADSRYCCYRGAGESHISRRLLRTTTPPSAALHSLMKVQRVHTHSQGAGKKNKIGDPSGGWVVQSTKKGWGQIHFIDIFLLCF